MSTRITAHGTLVDAFPGFGPRPAIRRRITPEAGKALELLAHALEYLADDYAITCEGKPCLINHLEAIEVLMELNRRVYFDCPPVNSAAMRCRAFLRRCLS